MSAGPACTVSPSQTMPTAIDTIGSVTVMIANAGEPSRPDWYAFWLSSTPIGPSAMIA